MVNQGCDRCCGEKTAGILCPQCFPPAKTPDPVVIEIDADATACTGINMNKSKTVREGDYIWIGGKKRLWRTLSKNERKRAIKDMKEEALSKEYNFGKRKSW